MLKHDNVALITDGITKHDVCTADVIIYVIGFQASEFLTPMKVVVRDGVDLHEQWEGNGGAYLGIMSTTSLVV